MYTIVKNVLKCETCEKRKNVKNVKHMKNVRTCEKCITIEAGPARPHPPPKNTKCKNVRTCENLMFFLHVIFWGTFSIQLAA